MLPTLAADDPVHMADGNTKVFADSTQMQTGCPHFADCADVSLREFGLPVTCSQRTGAMPALIGSILFRRRPTKISGTVVIPGAVSMRSLVQFRRLRSMECRAYDDVYSFAFCRTQVEHLVFSSLGDWLQQGTGVKIASTKAIGDPAIHGSHPPKIGRLIAGMIRNWPPFFHVLDDSGSLRYPQSGITLLASRV